MSSMNGILNCVKASVVIRCIVSCVVVRETIREGLSFCIRYICKYPNYFVHSLGFEFAPLILCLIVLFSRDLETRNYMTAQRCLRIPKVEESELPPVLSRLCNASLRYVLK